MKDFFSACRLQSLWGAGPSWRKESPRACASASPCGIAPGIHHYRRRLASAYYDYRAFGSPTTLPYTVNRATYAVAPYYVWQPERPVPVYRHRALSTFYTVNELNDFAQAHTLSGLFQSILSRPLVALLFFAGQALLPPLIMLRRIFMDRRIRYLVLCVVFMFAGSVIQVFFITHYLAPFTAAFYAIGLQAMRH